MEQEREKLAEGTPQQPAQARAVKEDEIDLVALFQKLWKGKKYIVVFTLLFFGIGIVVTLFSAKKYTATTIMVPQTSENKSAGSLGGLAAMAGINLGSSSTEVIPTSTYAKILESLPFKKKLAETTVYAQKSSTKMSYEVYYKSYIVGGLLSGLFGGSSSNAGSGATTARSDLDVLQVSGEEQAMLNSIDQRLKIEIKEKEGYIALSFTMPEPIAAAQMLQSAQRLLQETVTEYKLQKAREEYDFVEKRCAEAERDFRAKQYAVAGFQDRNRDLFSSLPQARLQQLQAEYNVAFTVYTELAKQLENKRIKVKEDQPIFTIIEPVSVPTSPSGNRMLTIAILTFLGFVIGVGIVFLRDFRKRLKERV